MKTSLVITVIGNNQPGLISSLSGAATEHGANWLESHMANLAGQFAGIVHLDVSTENIEKITAAFKALESNGLNITIAPVTDESSDTSHDSSQRSLSLELVGQDHPGIIRDISQTLAANNVSIEELETECISGSMSGGDIFKASARLSVPTDVATEDLDQILNAVSDSLMVEVILEE